MDVKPKPFPKSFGACADMLFDLKEKRLAAQKIVEEFAEQEKALKEHIIQGLPKGDTGAIGKHHKVTVITKQIPQVRDWDAFYKYVSRTKSFELLQRRLSESAVNERLEAGKTVAGVEMFQAVTVSLTKV